MPIRLGHHTSVTQGARLYVPGLKRGVECLSSTRAAARPEGVSRLRYLPTVLSQLPDTFITKYDRGPVRAAGATRKAVRS
jgi:hypothetical protein